jgi:hypothetical protein
MTTSRNELHFEHIKGQAQFAYFQLGGAASAIAFAIHQTNDRSLQDTPWPLGVAVIFWAISFALGCLGMTARQQGIATNVRFLDATQGAHPNVLQQIAGQAYDDALKITQNDLDRPVKRFRWQLWTLFAGALFFIAGHVMDMVATPPRVDRLSANSSAPLPKERDAGSVK